MLSFENFDRDSAILTARSVFSCNVPEESSNVVPLIAVPKSDNPVANALIPEEKRPRAVMGSPESQENNCVAMSGAGRAFENSFIFVAIATTSSILLWSTSTPLNSSIPLANAFNSDAFSVPIRVPMRSPIDSAPAFMKSWKPGSFESPENAAITSPSVANNPTKETRDAPAPENPPAPESLTNAPNPTSIAVKPDENLAILSESISFIR